MLVEALGSMGAFDAAAVIPGQVTGRSALELVDGHTLL
jgi:hypothetical protein